VRAIRQQARTGSIEKPAPTPQRRDPLALTAVACLQLGHRMAQLGITAWTIAGVAFPIVMLIAGVPLSGTQSLHFFGSLVLCGLIGASYPFFGVTALVVDVWYPALLRPFRRPAEAERACFAWLEKISARYFVLAGAIPLLSVSLLTMLSTTQSRFFLGALSLGGLAVVALVFLLHRRILENLRLLSGLPAYHPARTD
jgi:hypothetical protein